MIPHRKHLVLVAVLVALSFTVSTSSVSSVSADRGIEVAVVDDQTAFLTFDQHTENTANGTTSLTVTVGNQYPDGTTLTSVTVAVQNTPVDRTETRQLDAGTQHTWTFDSVSCSDTLSIEADGPDVYTSFERPIICQ